MRIHIRSNDTLEVLQKSFNATFPYLKIEFFSRPHESVGPTEKQYMISPKRTVDSCNSALEETVLTIPLAMTVLELESIFQNESGL